MSKTFFIDSNLDAYNSKPDSFAGSIIEVVHLDKDEVTVNYEKLWKACVYLGIGVQLRLALAEKLNIPLSQGEL